MIKSYKLRRHIANAFVYLFLIVMGFVWISPFIYLLMHSFRGGAEIYGSTIIPQEWTLQNYIDLFTGSGGTASLNFPRWFLNTFVVACFSCVISTISVLMVSYAFSRLRFKARKKFMNVGMILGMFPGFMTMIAIYYLLKAMGLTQTLVALVICYSCGAGLGFQKASSIQFQEHLTRRQPLTVLPKTRFSGRLFFLCQSRLLFTRFLLHLSDRGQTSFLLRLSWVMLVTTILLLSVFS